VISAAIPLWNLTLSRLSDRDFYHGIRIVYANDGERAEYDPDPENLGDEGGPGRHEDIRWYWENHVRRTILPEPKPFDADTVEGPLEPFSLRDKLGGSGRPLQVIVKLANIVLTPDKPEYAGGTWHVEGKLVGLLPHPFLSLSND
jgi:Protein of unknown function (DUF4246)